MRPFVAGAILLFACRTAAPAPTSVPVEPAAAAAADPAAAGAQAAREQLAVASQVPALRAAVRQQEQALEAAGDARAVGAVANEATFLAQQARAELARAPVPAAGSELVAELVTNHGRMLLEFFEDDAPKHVQNFIDLARRGFYDGLTLHRVVPGYLIQGGDPLGTGMGGPGYTLAAEFNDRPHKRGTLSMARAGHPDTAGSQFFLCLADLPALDHKYTVFGRLIAGHDVLDAIAELGSPGGQTRERVLIEGITIRPRTPNDVPESR